MPPLALIVLLLTVAFPLLELALLIKVGSIIGVWPLLAIIIGTAVLGVTVVQRQGLGVARRMMTTLRSGQPPHEPIFEGMLLMFAGACLVAPGLITDSIGLILLIPKLRQFAARTILAHHFFGIFPSTRPPSNSQRRPRQPAHPTTSTTIEGDYERISETVVHTNPKGHQNDAA